MISNDMLRYFSKNTTRIYGKDALREKRPVNQAGPASHVSVFSSSPISDSASERQTIRNIRQSVFPVLVTSAPSSTSFRISITCHPEFGQETTRNTLDQRIPASPPYSSAGNIRKTLFSLHFCFHPERKRNRQTYRNLPPVPFFWSSPYRFPPQRHVHPFSVPTDRRNAS